MSAAALGDGGAVPAKMRELIALAIAVTRECDGCVAAHARGAARRGATAQEVAETLGVAISMKRRPGHSLGAPGLCRLPGIRRRVSLTIELTQGGRIPPLAQPEPKTYPLPTPVTLTLVLSP